MSYYFNYSDEQLIAVVQEYGVDSNRAFNILYNRYAIALNTYCRIKTHNSEEAESIASEVWGRFYKYILDNNNIYNVCGLLQKMARSIIIDNTRAKLASPITYSPKFNSDNYVSTDCTDQHRDLEVAEMLDLIENAMNELKAEYREVFYLKKYELQTINEIAEMKGINPELVKKRLYRATVMIKEKLSQYIEEIRND